MKLQSGETPEVTKVPIEGKEGGAIFERKGCDKGVDGGQSHTSRARKTNQRGGIPIGLEAPRFKWIPKAKLALDARCVTAKSLEHLCNDDTA